MMPLLKKTFIKSGISIFEIGACCEKCRRNTDWI